MKKFFSLLSVLAILACSVLSLADEAPMADAPVEDAPMADSPAANAN